tara:strand:- start:1369 stop:1653 length:285 start_codon:yes stop_codon:yes gene_type:complete
MTKKLNETGKATAYLRCLALASKSNDADSQRALGNMYETGKGVTQDKAKAAGWYLRAAQQGDAKGQICLGKLYETGEGVTKNEAEAENCIVVQR